MDISQLSEKELIELNHRIIERLKHLETLKHQEGGSELSVGERVCFEPATGTVITGTLLKFNSKTVCVLTDQGEKWNVSPRFLVKLRPSREQHKKGNIIQLPS